MGATSSRKWNARSYRASPHDAKEFQSEYDSRSISREALPKMATRDKTSKLLQFLSAAQPNMTEPTAWSMPTRNPGGVATKQYRGFSHEFSGHNNQVVSIFLSWPLASCLGPNEDSHTIWRANYLLPRTVANCQQETSRAGPRKPEVSQATRVVFCCLPHQERLIVALRPSACTVSSAVTATTPRPRRRRPDSTAL